MWNLWQIFLLSSCTYWSVSSKTTAYTDITPPRFPCSDRTISTSHTVDRSISLSLHFREWSLPHGFILHCRLIYAVVVTEWYQNGVFPRARPTRTTIERPPPDSNCQQKHVQSTMRPINEISYYCHLYTRRRLLCSTLERLIVQECYGHYMANGNTCRFSPLSSAAFAQFLWRCYQYG